MTTSAGGVTLDQLRTFIAAADEGSFSAAGRKLRRAQSVVSQTLANLEGQIGVKLFDRSGRLPVLTPQGQVLRGDARTVAGGIDLLKAHAKGLAGGLESELSIVIDVMFPMSVLTAAVTAFHAAFPMTPLRLYVESLGSVIEPILDGRCTLGVIGPIALVPAQFSQEMLLNVPIVQVTSPRHPLASHGKSIPTTEIAKHVQLVLTDRSTLSQGRNFGVLSPKTWRLADLGAKHAFLRAGLGWGGMPAERVASDIARGTLVKIIAEDAPLKGFGINMSAVYPTAKPPGPAGRWLIDRLKRRSDAPRANSGRRRDRAGRPGSSAAR
jgi:DNA-binding transcriptional LysR family regulator